MNRFATLLAAATLAAAGCNDAKPTGGSAGSATGAATVAAESDVTANLARLSPEDQAVARAQRLCPVTDEPLGSMGAPVKVMVNDRPVFLCCKGCQKSALKDPDKTLAKVDELKKGGGKKE